jgi:hypothetical protein
MMRLAAVGGRRALLNVGMTGACAYVLRPKVAFARGSIDRTIQDRMAQVDAVDKERVRQEQLKAVEEAFPYLKGHITSDALLNELDYIRVFYKTPLSAERRILLRSKVQRFVKDENLSQETVDGLVRLMEEYGVL